MDFLTEGVDLAIRAGALKDSSLIAKKVGEVFFAVFASPRYLQSRGAPTHPNDLHQHDCIHFSSISSTSWKLESGKRSIEIPLEGKVAANDINLVRQFILSGQGIGMLPSFLTKNLKSERLVRVLPDWRSNVSPLHFVYPAQKFVAPAVKAFIDMSTPVMRKQFSQEFV